MLQPASLPVFDACRAPTALIDDPELAEPCFRPSAPAGVPIVSDGRTSRSPSEHRSAIATAGNDDEPRPALQETNLRREFAERRLPPELAETADDIADLFAQAHAIPSAPTISECRNLGCLTSPERRVCAQQVLGLVAYRCGHLWADLLRAVIDDESMTEIGGPLGGNSRDSARLGRQRVTDALTFAASARADIDRWSRAQERAITTGQAIRPIVARAIGQQSAAPAWIHTLANDDMRRAQAA